MKKLLLLISLCGGLCLISCKKDETQNTETATPVDTNAQKMPATQVATQDSNQVKKDSVVQAKTKEMKQSVEKGGTKVAIPAIPDGKGTKSEGEKSKEVKSVGKDPGKEKGTTTSNPPVRIDHKADEQAKIDSIKKAKGQGKK